jgi:Cys/Met metabolism PLP-dependent enzyme
VAARPPVRARTASASAEARADLEEDLSDLLLLVSSALARLTRLRAALDGTPLSRETAFLLRYRIGAASTRYRGYERALLALRGGSPARMAAGKRALADVLRVEQAGLGSVVVAADWQSPWFGVTPHVDDYKRDRYAAAGEYEQAFARACVDAPARVLVTACGMAAFTTIVETLRLEGLPRPVAYGREVYHETKELLARGLAGPAVEVDERDVAALRALQPSALFVDALSNSPALLVPDLRALAEALPPEATLVVDTTGLSVRSQPLRLTGRVIAFESLLKHVQLGLDRANAGAIVCRPEDAPELDLTRERLGTIAPDWSVAALPDPDRDVLERRLARLERNAGVLAGRLPRASWAGCGSYLVLDPGMPLETYVARAVAAARAAGALVVAGSSFGFDATRLYVTGAGSGIRDPFLRVSAGTEDRLEVEAVAEALSGACA